MSPHPILSGTVLDGPVYVRSPRVIGFIVPGIAAPQGSKSARVLPGGRISMREASKALKPWRDEVIRVIRDLVAYQPGPAAGWPLLGPVAVDLVFTMPKPKSAPKRRTTYPIVKPDIDKIARAILDAGTFGGLWHDDAQVVDLHPYKVYPRETPKSLAEPGVLIEVFTIGPQVDQPALLDP